MGNTMEKQIMKSEEMQGGQDVNKKKENNREKEPKNLEKQKCIKKIETKIKKTEEIKEEQKEKKMKIDNTMRKQNNTKKLTLDTMKFIKAENKIEIKLDTGTQVKTLEKEIINPEAMNVIQNTKEN